MGKVPSYARDEAVAVADCEAEVASSHCAGGMGEANASQAEDGFGILLTKGLQLIQLT